MKLVAWNMRPKETKNLLVAVHCSRAIGLYKSGSWRNEPKGKHRTAFSTVDLASMNSPCKRTLPVKSQVKGLHSCRRKRAFLSSGFDKVSSKADVNGMSHSG